MVGALYKKKDPDLRDLSAQNKFPRPAQLAQLVERKTFNLVVRGSSPLLGTYSSLAQSEEHTAVNRGVVGSKPTGGAIAVPTSISFI